MRLSEPHRELIILFDVEGYKINEINEITGLEIGTIKSRLHRARAQLKQCLQEGTFSSPPSCKAVGDES